MLPCANAMIFVDYLGSVDRFPAVKRVTQTQIATAVGIPPASVTVRRVLTEDPGDEAELWVELSSDEQLYRVAQKIAEGISHALHQAGDNAPIWVMYRIVPLKYTFLNGRRRGRGGVD